MDVLIPAQVPARRASSVFFFFVSAWPISRSILASLFRDAEAEPDGSISILDEVGGKLAELDLQGTVVLADVVTELPRDNNKPTSALTHQLWESQSFHVSKIDGPFSAELHPIRTKTSRRLIGALYNIHLAISVHRGRIMKPVYLYTVLQKDPISLHNRLLSASGAPGARIKADVDARYGMLSQLDNPAVANPNGSERVLAQASSTVVVARPLSLTTSIVDNTMYVFLENVAEEFTLILESINTRNSCCSNEMPFALAPGDQYCFPLKFSPELMYQHQSASDLRPQWNTPNVNNLVQQDHPTSRAVFPLAIKWRFNGVEGSSAWAQFGANCSTGPPTPIVAILTAGQQAAGHLPGSHEGPYKKGLTLTLVNNGDEVVDVVLVLLDSGKKWIEKQDVLDIMEQNPKLSVLATKTDVGRKIYTTWKSVSQDNESLNGYSQWAETTHDVGAIKPKESRSTALDI